jgi:hypothetical protein
VVLEEERVFKSEGRMKSDLLETVRSGSRVFILKGEYGRISEGMEKFEHC